MKKRVFMIVLDSVGIGALPDWQEYDTEPGNTIVHVAEACGGLSLPHCESLGLGNIMQIKGVKANPQAEAHWGKAPLTTCGKDTTAGHWEMMGIILKQQFPVFPQGFPAEFVQQLETAFGRGILCNRPYSGTQVIEDYGEDHLNTGKPIVYTSADSVLQIACHEDVYDKNALYDICRKARSLCKGKYGVGRVIARPFKGELHHFERTKNRKDFSLLPPEPNYLTALQNKGIHTVGVGKISDIFAGMGLEQSYPVKGNAFCLETLLNLLETETEGFFFINLVDFDMLYGHRNDAHGYGKALEEFDRVLGKILPQLKTDDLLIITADHGNDPTTDSTDHNREYVPVLMKSAGNKGDIGILSSLADMGATAYRFLTETNIKDIPGESVFS